MNKTIDVNDIKKRFPAPTKSYISKKEGDAYCVGGAFCKYLQEQIGNVNSTTPNFPDINYLTKQLRRANPNLDLSHALHYACAITHKNDGGSFKVAWHVLKEALEYNEDI